MPRSIWKGPYIRLDLLKKIKQKAKQKIKSWSRDTMIIPDFLGSQFDIYNGKKFVTVSVSEEMIGHKFGEFAPTRKTAIHKKK